MFVKGKERDSMAVIIAAPANRLKTSLILVALLGWEKDYWREYLSNLALNQQPFWLRKDKCMCHDP
jgi:hypothetical protein